jgi:SPFH domain / Band 7 family
VQSQELMTGDGMGVRISLGGEYRVVNPTSFATESSDAFGVFFLKVRHAARVAVGELNSQNFLSGHLSLTDRMKELLVPKPSQLGIEMIQLEVSEAVPTGWLRQV